MSSNEPIIVTHSDIKDFLSCRRKWHYNFVLDFRPPEKLTGPLALGTRVHAALEAYYKGETSDPVAWIDQKGRDDLEAMEYNSEAKPWDFDNHYDDMVIGRNCMVLYMEWLEETGADDNLRTVSVEQKVEVPLLDGRAVLRGKVDILQEDVSSGLLCVNDFKTYGREDGLRETLERSFQHWCYIIGMQHSYPDQNVECARYTMIRKTKKIPAAAPKTPFVQRFTVPATRRALSNKKAQIERIASEMIYLRDQEDPAVFYPSPGDPCRWCPYKAPCEIQDESAEAALALLGNGGYTQGTRYARYETGDPKSDA